MPIQITTDAATTFVAEKWLNFQYSEKLVEEKERLLPAVKYNILATGFNFSTVLLVAAVAAAIFATIPTALGWGAAGLLLRFIVEKEISTYSLLSNGNPLNKVVHILGVDEPIERIAAIFTKCKMSVLTDWKENEAIFFDVPAWKNLLPVQG